MSLPRISFASAYKSQTAEERTKSHSKIMNLQENFMRRVAERLRVYVEAIRSSRLESQREWNKYE